MKVKVIENYKERFNNWNTEEGNDWYDEIRRLVFDVRDGIAEEEAIAIAATGVIVECFKGWEFQLPKTKDAIQYKGEPMLRFYEEIWDGKNNYTLSETPVIWRIKDEAPPVARRFLRDCSVWISGQV